jgi:hypothetical protein
VGWNAAETFGFRSICGSDLGGDSHEKHYRNTLREGLQLRDQFPQHDVKVQSMQPDGQQRAAAH